MRRDCLPILLGLVTAASGLPAQTPPPPGVPQLLGAQFNVIGQHVAPFTAPYRGLRSLVDTGDTEVSETYGVYLGVALPSFLQAYLDVEMARGNGIGQATGLGGPTNGDVIRQGTADLSRGPYIARVMVRYLVPLSDVRDTILRGIDQVPGLEPSSRFEFKVGKLAASDDFDVNRYANSTRSQFMNWGLFQNTAWDFAADTRGYTWGAVVAWVHPAWTLRVGVFTMPTMANGNEFDWSFPQARGDNVEFMLRPGSGGTAIRLLAYENHAHMGSYDSVLARAAVTGGVPDIVADDRAGRTKGGFGLNIEQPLADAGETGGFLRAGWNDGKNESFAFAEVDRHLSMGGQISGAHWGRAADRLAVAGLLHGLSAEHQAYLAAGGSGFLLGDGRLNYAAEEIVEAQYRMQFGAYVVVSPDIQWIGHPGYNRDRGPAYVLSLRINARY